jgi:hypothetical protein
MKKNILIGSAIVILGVAGYFGATFLQDKMAASALVARQKACAVDINAIVLKDEKKALKTDRQIVEAVFNHYFEAYKAIPDCPTAGISEYRLAEIGKIETKGTNILADITFELKPISLDKTEWATPEATTTPDGWVKGKKGMLSIQKNKDSYTLNL